MAGELAEFQFPQTGQPIRTLNRDGEPWFAVADVCAVLGLDRTRDVMSALDEDEKLRDTVAGTLVNLVSEPGLYSLILRSRKDEAKTFKRWVTHEVLPAIRKTGRYESAHVPATRKELSNRELAMMVIEEADRADRAEAALGIAQPKAEAYESFMDADGTYSYEHVAKMLYTETGLGRNNMLKRLRDMHVLEKTNVPYQRYAEHFHVVAQTFEGKDGRRSTTYTTRVYPSGVDFIRRKLLASKGMLVPALIS